MSNMHQPEPALVSRRSQALLQWGSVIVGALYFNGFYINTLFIANYGIFRSELLRLDYIKIGFIFSLITLGIVFIPCGILYLTWKVRSASKLPNFYVGLVGNSANTFLTFTAPLFLACFATIYEWHATLVKPIFGIGTVEGALIISLCLSGAAMVLVPAFERGLLKMRPAIRGWAFSIVVEPLRFVPIFVSAWLIGDIIRSISWMPSMLMQGIYYFLTAIIFVIGALAAVLWARKIGSIRGSAFLLYSLVGFGLAVLYYMSVTSYVFGVYKFIPKNRGGALPLNEVFIKTEEPKILPTSLKETALGYGPLYLVEENDDYLFFAYEGIDRWTIDFIPIYVISKDDAKQLYIRRIEGGYPRR